MTVNFPWELGQIIWMIEGSSGDYWLEKVRVTGYELSITDYGGFRSCDIEITHIDGRIEIFEISDGDELCAETGMLENWLFTTKEEAKKELKRLYERDHG